MHHIFQILPAGIIAAETNFFGEVSSGGLSFFFQNNEDKMITGLSVFNFEKRNGEYSVANTLEKILENEKLLKDKFNKIYISYAFEESILIPALYYNAEQNNENLNLVFGDLVQGIVLADHVSEKNVYNIYRIPKDIHHEIITLFGEVTFIHQYSLLLKQLPPVHNLLKVIFYQNKIVIVLQKEGKLQIIQAFKYVTAGDVLYHMLNVCNQFNFKEVTVQLCGMIEKDSTLFREIEKYFVSINFAHLPGELSYTDEIKEFPGHFFNHLFAFALCV